MKNKTYYYHTVVIEGIDKTGKDTLARYIDHLCGHWLCLPRRGIVSNLAYATLYGRDPLPVYPLDQHDTEVYVYLRCTSKDDWEMRCKLTNEPPIDYEKNVAAFEITWNNFKRRRRAELSLEFDTSKMTVIQIAEAVVAHLEKLNSSAPDQTNRLIGVS